MLRDASLQIAYHHSAPRTRAQPLRRVPVVLPSRALCFCAQSARRAPRFRASSCHVTVATSPTVDEELNCGAGVLASTVRCATVGDGACVS